RLFEHLRDDLVLGDLARLRQRAHAAERYISHQGYTPSSGRPSVSGRPYMTLAHCIACPAAPFTRLSSALMAIRRWLCSSTATETKHRFEPSVHFVCGVSATNATNGSSA